MLAVSHWFIALTNCTQFLHRCRLIFMSFGQGICSQSGALWRLCKWLEIHEGPWQKSAEDLDICVIAGANQWHDLPASDGPVTAGGQTDSCLDVVRTTMSIARTNMSFARTNMSIARTNRKVGRTNISSARTDIEDWIGEHKVQVWFNSGEGLYFWGKDVMILNKRSPLKRKKS